MAQSVKFVDRPGGTVLLDVSPGSASGIQLGEAGLDAPPPPLDRAIAANPAMDGGTVTTSLYALRTVTLSLAYTAGVRATTVLESAARRAAASTLMRVLSRERVWLEVIAEGAAEARYLHCYRSTDENMAAALDGLGSRWMEAKVALLADPFAYGALESVTSQVTSLATDFKTTIAGSGIKGDVPAPLIVRIATTSGAAARTLYMASKVGGAKHKAVVEFQDLPAAGTVPAGSTFAPGVTGLATCLNGNADRWSGVATGQELIVGRGGIITAPGGVNDLIQGSYRVFLYAPTETSGDTWEHALYIESPGSHTSLFPKGILLNRPVRGGSGKHYEDFGIVDVPYGGRESALGFAAPGNVQPAQLDVRATLVTAGGAGAYASRIYDAMLVLPADDTFLTFQWAEVTGIRVHFIDPTTGAVVTQTGSGTVVSDSAKVSAVGETPYVVPGTDVDVFAFQHVGGQGINPTGIPTGVTWSGTYYPRYLTVV